MENNQQIDQLFQDAFKELPNDMPSGNWDTPAPSTWSAIEQKMQVTSPVTSTFATKLLLAMVGAIALAGLAFLLYRSSLKDAPKAPTAIPTQTVPVQTPEAAPANALPQHQPEPEITTQQKASEPIKQPVKTEKPAEKPAHNNLERRRQEAQKSKE